jgi:hypothetical protein
MILVPILVSANLVRSREHLHDPEAADLPLCERRDALFQTEDHFVRRIAVTRVT